MSTAAIVVIGNEILSGKVVDTNSPYLCRELRGLGVDYAQGYGVSQPQRVQRAAIA